MSERAHWRFDQFLTKPLTFPLVPLHFALPASRFAPLPP